MHKYRRVVIGITVFLLSIIGLTSLLMSQSYENQVSETLLPIVNGEWSFEDSYVEGPPWLWAYPYPDGSLMLAEYEQGLPDPRGYHPDEIPETYNICVGADPLYLRHIGTMRLPVLSPTPTVVEIQTSRYGTPLFELSEGDYWGNVELWLDDQQLNIMQFDEENALEVQDGPEYFMCYNILLEIGTHTMRYVFRWTPEDILDIGEWAFTIVEDPGAAGE